MRAKMGFKAKLQGSTMVGSFSELTIFVQVNNIIRNSSKKSDKIRKLVILKLRYYISILIFSQALTTTISISDHIYFILILYYIKFLKEE